MMSELTLIIIIVTAILSIQAFSNTQLMNKLIFNPFVTKQRGEWYRFVTSGFLHADWIHLLINMFVLFSFGNAVQYYYGVFFGWQVNGYTYCYMLAAL